MNLNILLRDVFNYKQAESITVLFDIPESARKDNPGWEKRRKIAAKWHKEIQKFNGKARLVSYAATGLNNADLPEKCQYDKKQILLKISYQILI